MVSGGGSIGAMEILTRNGKTTVSRIIKTTYFAVIRRRRAGDMAHAKDAPSHDNRWKLPHACHRAYWTKTPKNTRSDAAGFRDLPETARYSGQSRINLPRRRQLERWVAPVSSLQPCARYRSFRDVPNASHKLAGGGQQIAGGAAFQFIEEIVDLGAGLHDIAQQVSP